MRNPLKRYYGQGDLHFVTFSCYRRRALLGSPQARDRFVSILDEVRSRHSFQLIGYVLMPEHVHLLVSEPVKGSPSLTLQVLKQKVSRALHEEGKDAAFWQRRFYDFNVWSAQKLKEKLNYMHANPVERKLVLHPKDWPWSSWLHYVKGEEGLIRIDSLEEWKVVEESHPHLNTEGCGTPGIGGRENPAPMILRVWIFLSRFP